MTPGTDRPSGHVFFSGDDRLEGLLEWPEAVPQAAGGVVVAHPHPLYGGTMAQPVVYRVAQACRRSGLASLRFNFRGVGESGGRYSGSDEYRDVEAAAAFLRGRLSADLDPSGTSGRHPPLALAGYSFGSVMVAQAAAGEVPVQALALIAFVVGWDDMPSQVMSRLGTFRGPVLAVCGEADDLAPPGEVQRVLKALRLDFQLEVVAEAGHLFEHKQREVGELVAAFLADKLSAAIRRIRR